jgi:N-acetylneuraminic acid mutarotase
MGVRGTKIYLAGGMRTLTPGPGGLQDTVATVSSYDVVTGRWESLPSLPQARDHVGGAIVGGTFYVLGGRDRGQVNVRDTVYAFDLRARRWIERAPMPTARGGIAAAAVGSTIYTFGGEGNPAEGSNGVFAQTEAYDTERNRWQRLAPMPVPRHGTAAVAVGGTIYIPGGGDAAGAAPMDVIDAFRPRHR